METIVPGNEHHCAEFLSLHDESAMGVADEQCTSEWFYSLMMDRMTGLELSPEDAKEIYSRIRRHQSVLAGKLGRDPGLRVAALDYLANIEGMLPDARIVSGSALDSLMSATNKDAKTGCFNGKYFRDYVEKEISRCGRSLEYFSILMIDIDDFKRINDTCGHVFGDRVIEAFAGTILQSARTIDVVSRFGGDEFAVILPQTGRVGARSYAERLRIILTEQFGEKECLGGELEISFSAGIATYPLDGDTYESLLESADQALYRSKQLGKNRVFDSLEAEFFADLASERERRRSPRKRVESSALDLSSLAGIMNLKGRIVDVSEGGLLLECNASLEEERFRRKLALRLPAAIGGDGARISGEVVRLQREAGKMKFYLGVKFHESIGGTAAGASGPRHQNR